MGTLTEPLILYLVLFFPGAVPSPQEPAAFSLWRELSRILLYQLPALALVWYLLLRTKSLKEWGITLPRRRDLVPGLLALPGLLLIGLTISLVIPLFDAVKSGPPIESPSLPAEWLMMILSCFVTGYLEESFFRFYLSARLEGAGFNPPKITALSVLFFSVCHLYEGPWGTLNAVLAGTLLSLVFLRFRSLHGIALAHGIYNIFVYAVGA
ncbi:MAG: CPBP family intramembrane metalloprotease [Treponema sp.]|nr:CPBP family intramembrane metalloprotease [Treponema sp.]